MGQSTLQVWLLSWAHDSWTLKGSEVGETGQICVLWILTTMTAAMGATVKGRTAWPGEASNNNVTVLSTASTEGRADGGSGMMQGRAGTTLGTFCTMTLDVQYSIVPCFVTNMVWVCQAYTNPVWKGRVDGFTLTTRPAPHHGRSVLVAAVIESRTAGSQITRIPFVTMTPSSCLLTVTVRYTRPAGIYDGAPARAVRRTKVGRWLGICTGLGTNGATAKAGLHSFVAHSALCKVRCYPSRPPASSSWSFSMGT